MTIALPTREDYFQIGAQEVFARGAARPRATRLSPEAVFTEGTDINILIAAQSAMTDEATRHLALRMAALFLDSAEGEDLDRLVADRFSPTVVRKQASPGLVELTLTRPVVGVAPAATIAVGKKVRTASGTEFKLRQAAAFPVNGSGPVRVAAEAILSGTGGNVAAGTIVQFIETPSDSTIQVTNEAPAAGGSDVETDESLRQRARNFFFAARRGTIPAIQFGCLAVAGVASATIEEGVDVTGMPTGSVRAFIADSNGQSNEILAAAVRANLLEYRAAGVSVDVLTSQPSFVEIDYILKFAAGTDTRAATDQLKALTVAQVNSLAPGQSLQRSLLYALCRQIPGAIVSSDAVQNPVGDLVVSSLVGATVFKTTLDRITVNGL